MQLDLHISADSPAELATVLAALGAVGGAKVSLDSTAPLAPHRAPAATSADDTSEEALAAARAGGDGVVDEAQKPKRGRGKAKAGPEPTQQPDGSPIPPTTEPAPQPTPGGTEAPPAESIPPNQEPAGIPAGQADVFGGGGGEATTGQPGATSGDAATGEVDLPMLKTAMADLLKHKPAAFAMKTLEDATGCKSLSSGSPSVIEKAKTDPSIMQVALDALVAGKDAAA
jgi:hypothetical protein